MKKDKPPPIWALNELKKYDKILIPVNVNKNHWSLIFIDSIKQVVLNFDSLYFSSSEMVDNIKKHFNNTLPKFKNMINWSSTSKISIPKQSNDHDCGIFLCLYARHLILDQKFAFHQDNIVQWRKHIESEILNFKILEVKSSN